MFVDARLTGEQRLRAQLAAARSPFQVLGIISTGYAAPNDVGVWVMRKVGTDALGCIGGLLYAVGRSPYGSDGTIDFFMPECNPVAVVAPPAPPDEPRAPRPRPAAAARGCKGCGVRSGAAAGGGSAAVASSSVVPTVRVPAASPRPAVAATRELVAPRRICWVCIMAALLAGMLISD